MQDTLIDFLQVARGAGVRISTSESLDALRAVMSVGIDDRTRLRETLGLTLAKTGEEKRVLQRCFDTFFAAHDIAGDADARATATATATANAPAALPSPTAGQANGSAGLSPLSAAILRDDNAEIQRRLAVASREAATGDIRLITQRGLFARRLLMAAGLGGLETDLERLEGSDDPAAQDQAERLRAARDWLRGRARQHVESQLQLHGKAAQEALREDMLMERPLAHLHDLDAMLPLVRRIARRLVSRQRRRLRREDHGRPDLRRTLRKALHTDGVVMRPQWRTRRIDRPRLMVLCDVSGSVSGASVFLLSFVFALVDVLDDVRAFAFSSRLGEVGDWFASLPAAEAARRTLARHGMGSTDVGRSLEDFLAIAGGQLDRRTTVIILSDARNNRGNPNVAALALIKRRSRQVLWLNPEQEARWGSGDSEMPRYLPHLTRASECRNLRQLERFAATLLGSSSTQGRLP
jgi:uncharacterized protein with von Willebrand factor type A (vWA) domain